MEKSPKPLEYDRTMRPVVTRGQFRLLLLLVLLQVVMTAQSTYAPNLTAWIKAQWAEHKATVAREADEKRIAQIEQQCAAFTRPPETVVWEEDADLAVPLLAQGGHQPVNVYDLTSSPAAALISPGACCPAPKSLDDVLLAAGPGRDGGLAFLHSRRSRGGRECLVMVWATGRLDLSNSLINTTPPIGQPIEGSLSKVHGLLGVARVTSANRQRAGLYRSAPASLWLRPYGEPLEMPVHWLPPEAPEQPTSIRVDWREQFRVYAGQPDSANSEHFTIDYAIDGVRSTIDGYLNDNGSLTLTPRQGKVSGGRWYPHAK